MPLFKFYRFLICSAIFLIFIFYAGNWMEISFLTRVQNISYDLCLKATVHNTFDSNVVNDVFIEEKVYMQYAHEFLDSEQINVD